jgi:hypothetical protein
MRKLAAGNWKMNGTGCRLAEVAALARPPRARLRDAALPARHADRPDGRAPRDTP